MTLKEYDILQTRLSEWLYKREIYGTYTRREQIATKEAILAAKSILHQFVKHEEGVKEE